MKITAEQPVTHPGQEFDAPWKMTIAWARVVGLVTIGIVSIALGVVGAVLAGDWLPVGVGAVVALPFLAFGALMAWYTIKSDRMIYPSERREEIKAGPHVVIEMTDNLKTPKGWVEKSTKRVDVGASPSHVLDALRYMKRTGKISREAVCGNTPLGQKPWKRLKDVLLDYNVIGDGGVTDEIDQLIAQIERQIRDL